MFYYLVGKGFGTEILICSETILRHTNICNFSVLLLVHIVFFAYLSSYVHRAFLTRIVTVKSPIVCKAFIFSNFHRFAVLQSLKRMCGFHGST